MQDRVKRARQSYPQWDRSGEYREKCGQLAQVVGVDAGAIYEEWEERASIRQYLAERDKAEAERLAWGDVLERFEVVL